MLFIFCNIGPFSLSWNILRFPYFYIKSRSFRKHIFRCQRTRIWMNISCGVYLPRTNSVTCRCYKGQRLSSHKPILIATPSKAWVCGRSPTGIGFSDSCQAMDISLLWLSCVVRYRSLGRVDHSSRGVLLSVVCQCDREASIMRRSWPTRSCRAMKIIHPITDHYGPKG